MMEVHTHHYKLADWRKDQDLAKLLTRQRPVVDVDKMTEMLEGLAIARSYTYDQDIVMAELEMNTLIEDMLLDVEEDIGHETMDKICQARKGKVHIWTNMKNV